MYSKTVQRLHVGLSLACLWATAARCLTLPGLVAATSPVQVAMMALLMVVLPVVVEVLVLVLVLALVPEVVAAVSALVLVLVLVLVVPMAAVLVWVPTTLVVVWPVDMCPRHRRCYWPGRAKHRVVPRP